MSPSKLRLRQYRRTDFEAIFHLDQMCFAAPFRFSRNDMRRYVGAADARVIVGEIDDELAGFYIVHLQKMGTEVVGYLTTIDVHSAFRRHGVGRELLHAAEVQVRQAGSNTMFLHVFVENDAAIRLYIREGYTLLSVQEDFYGPELNAAIYRKTLVE